MSLARCFCKTGPWQFLRGCVFFAKARCGSTTSLRLPLRRLTSFCRSWRTSVGLVLALVLAPVFVSRPAQLDAQARLQKPSSQTLQAGQGPRAKVTNPHGPGIGSCQNCHTFTSWKPIRSMPEFNHDETRYPLRGMHQDVGCTKCHTSLVFKNVSTHCVGLSCRYPYAPVRRQLREVPLGKGLAGIHAGYSESPEPFSTCGSARHVGVRRLPQGAATGQFIGLSTACYSCHQQDFKTTVIDHSVSLQPARHVTRWIRGSGQNSTTWR